MTDVRKINPEEIANAVSELNRKLKWVGGAPIERIDCSPAFQPRKWLKAPRISVQFSAWPKTCLQADVSEAK